MAKKKQAVSIRSSAAEYLTYVASVGDDENVFEVRYQDENIWLTQKMLAILYDGKVNTINYHMNKIFDDMEVEADSVIRKFRITANDGKPYDVYHYGLQMIIAVGFNANFIRRLQIFTQLQLIMIKMQNQQDGFLQLYKIRCIMQYMGIQLLN